MTTINTPDHVDDMALAAEISAVRYSIWARRERLASSQIGSPWGAMRILDVAESYEQDAAEEAACAKRYRKIADMPGRPSR